jgi:hypothetical protein
MPQNRSYLGTGSPYPTGKSPLVLDIENNIQNVVQQMVENKKSEIKEKKLTISDNEKMMLDALDMRAVEGMGDKVALEFGEGLEKIKNTWSKKFYEKEGMLSTQDKLTLRKDQMQLEQKLKNAAAEIKMMAEVKKELQIQALRPDKKGLYDYNQTSKRLDEYQKSGKVGSGAFINVPVMAKPEFGEEFVSKASPYLEAAAKSIKGTVKVIDESTGLVQDYRTNKPFIDSVGKNIEQMPEYQQLLVENPTEAAKLKDRLMQQYLKVSDLQDFDSGLQRQNAAYSKYGLTPIEQENSDFFNNIAEGVLTADSEILRSLVGSVDKKLGTIKAVEYVESQNAIRLVPNDPKMKPEIIPLPSDRSKKDAVLRVKRNILERFSIIGNKVADKKTMDTIEADWGKLEKSEPAMPYEVKSTVDLLGTSPKAIQEQSQAAYDNDKTGTVKVITNDVYRDMIIDKIKKAVPDSKIETVSRKYWFGTNPSKIRIPFKEGTVEYDLTNEKDRQELSDWIVENSKYKERLSKKHGYIQPESKNQSANEVLVTLKNGKKAYFTNDTHKFIRYAE